MAALAANKDTGSLAPRLAAVQAAAATQIVEAVQTGLAGHQKLLFAVAAAAAIQRCQGKMPGAEWEALVEAAPPVQLDASMQACTEVPAGHAAPLQRGTAATPHTIESVQREADTATLHLCQGAHATRLL